MQCPNCGTVNPQHNRFCNACGTALGGGPAGESARRVATVLFADMTGFTAMSESLDPEEVHEITNDFLRSLTACVHRYGGTVDKYIGDEIMALFGAPRAHEDDPERALATALEMLQSLRAVNERLAQRLPEPRRLHAGINTGLVIAGRVGDTNRSEYTVLGDTVNLASRLCDLAEPGQVFVSESTYRHTRHVFGFKQLEPVRVKGKAEPVPLYELLGRRSRRESRRGLPGLRARLVGRDAELAQLSAAVERLEQGSGGLVTVTGPAGAGKTRLLGEARLAAARRRVKWAQAACASLGLGGSLGVWGDLVRQILGVGQTADRRSVSMRISTSMRIATTGTSVISLDELRGAEASLSRLLHLDLSAEERQRLGGPDEEALRRRLFMAVRDLIEAEAGRQPLALVLDDLHWCDSASLGLLSYVLESTARVPLLVVTAFRSDAEVRGDLEEAVARAAPPARVDIELQPLSPGDSAALAAELIGTDPALADIRELLVGYAAGSPLFLEEVLRSLIAQGMLRHEDGVWRRPSQEPSAVVLPETLQGLLQDRIDRLPESSKRMVQIAAVIGRTFPSALLAQIGGFGSGQAVLLAELEQAGFFERGSGPGGADYRFRQSLMQEAAYASLLHRHRRDYHRRVAEWYERQQTGPQPPAELAAILAHHWERAEEWTQAGRWALRAADEARRAFALNEARDLYNRALQAADRAGDTDVRRAAEQGLGEIDVATGAPSALAHFTAALELAHEPLDRAALERWIGQVLDRDGQYSAALAAFSRAAAILGDRRPDERPEWTVERARLRLARAGAHLRRSDDELAQITAEAALSADLPPADRADANILLGRVLLRRGNAEQAAVYLDEALTLARAAGDLRRAAVALQELGAAAQQRRDYTLARRYLVECAGVLRRLGDHAALGSVLTGLAMLDEREGNLLQAAERLREAIAYTTTADEPVTAAYAQLLLGRVLRVLGDWSGASAALARAGRDDPELAGRASLELALLAIERGEEPDTDLQQALEEGERYGIPGLAPYARVGLAAAARRRRRREEARAYLRDVLLGADGREDDATTMARVGLVELALDEGRADVALASGGMALAAAERTGPAALVWRARRLLGTALGVAGRHDEAEEQLRLATAAARAAEAYPELAHCLAAWAGVRTRAAGEADAEAHAMLAERREILAFLAGDAPPPAPIPAPAGSGAT